jgi:hypothetical protein
LVNRLKEKGLNPFLFFKFLIDLKKRLGNTGNGNMLLGSPENPSGKSGSGSGSLQKNRKTLDYRPTLDQIEKDLAQKRIEAEIRDIKGQKEIDLKNELMNQYHQKRKDLELIEAIKEIKISPVKIKRGCKENQNKKRQ